MYVYMCVLSFFPVCTTLNVMYKKIIYKYKRVRIFNYLVFPHVINDCLDMFHKLTQVSKHISRAQPCIFQKIYKF